MRERERRNNTDLLWGNSFVVKSRLFLVCQGHGIKHLCHCIVHSEVTLGVVF